MLMFGTKVFTVLTTKTTSVNAISPSVKKSRSFAHSHYEDTHDGMKSVDDVRITTTTVVEQKDDKALIAALKWEVNSLRLRIKALDTNEKSSKSGMSSPTRAFKTERKGDKNSNGSETMSVK